MDPEYHPEHEHPLAAPRRVNWQAVFVILVSIFIAAVGVVLAIIFATFG